MKWRVVPVAVLTLTASAIGCAGPDVASVGSNVPRAGGAILSPFVQAGTLFSVRMDQPLDTLENRPGSPFTATVVDPLRGSTGEVLVAYGAKVRGTIASVGPPDRPRLRLHIDTIDTIAGALPVQAAVRRAQHLAWAGPARVEPDLAGDGYIEGSEFYDPDWMQPYWTGPSAAPAYGDTVERPREIHVPRGALVELALLRPLVVRPARRPAPGG